MVEMSLVSGCLDEAEYFMQADMFLAGFLVCNGKDFVW